MSSNYYNNSSYNVNSFCSFLKIILWSAYFAMLVYFIVLHPQYVRPISESFTEMDKLLISIITFIIFFIVGLLFGRFASKR